MVKSENNQKVNPGEMTPCQKESALRTPRTIWFDNNAEHQNELRTFVEPQCLDWRFSSN